MDYRGAYGNVSGSAAVVKGYDVTKDVTDLAAELGVSIAPHGCQELQLPFAAAILHGEFLEIYPVAVDPLGAKMFQPLMKPDEDGYMTASNRPSIGYELNMGLLNRYRVG